MKECERLSNNIPTIDMNVDREAEMNLSLREIHVLLLHEFLLSHEATNNILIDSTMGIMHWTIHLALEDQSKWIWID